MSHIKDREDAKILETEVKPFAVFYGISSLRSKAMNQLHTTNNFEQK